MPMGISINVATYSAKLLMQVAYNPQVGTHEHSHMQVYFSFRFLLYFFLF